MYMCGLVSVHISNSYIRQLRGPTSTSTGATMRQTSMQSLVAEYHCSIKETEASRRARAGQIQGEPRVCDACKKRTRGLVHRTQRPSGKDF